MINFCAQCHFPKVNVKMFVIYNDVLFNTDIRDLILIHFYDLKIVKSAIGLKTMQLHLLFNIYL